MKTLIARPYAGEMDLEAIAALIQECETVDRLEENTSIAELRQEIHAPGVDRDRDLCLWEDSNGTLIAFAQLWIPQTGEPLDGFLWFRVHPTARGSDLEVQIVGWGEARMREVSQERGVRVRLRSGTRASDRDRLTLLEQCGFTSDRYLFRMARSLTEPIPELTLPPGFCLHFGEQQKNAIAWIEMYNRSFIDHWNFHELTQEHLVHEWNHSNYQPEFDLVALAADGTFASFCYCRIDADRNQQNGRNEGWIVVLGTRRGFRQQGLARALLLAGMQQLKAAGMDTALLGVDAQNPTGALKLYESVGFHHVLTKLVAIKAL